MEIEVHFKEDLSRQLHCKCVM